MNSRDPKLVALQFNECINNQDLNGLAFLMTDDHAFIDREGKVTQGKQTMVESWKQFFEMFPEYRNTFNCVQSRDNRVTILGYAHWSKEEPYDPVIWTATIVSDLVQEWRVHVDTATNRRECDLL